jgi:hypothetical protein
MDIKKQIANSFDAITINRIVKGALWSFLDAGVLAGLAYLGNVEVANPTMMLFLGWLSPFLVNAWNEYRKGETEYSVDRDDVV